MKKRGRFLVACVAALAVCSCTPQAELDRARAEADAARREAEMARQEAERARAEVEVARARERAEAKTATAQAQIHDDDTNARRKDKADEARLLAHLEDVRTRWNAAAGGVTVQPPGFGPVNFAWNNPDQFPHPTYKGGSAEAYGAFAGALQSFFENDDNFEFLAKNNLFTTELRYNLPSGMTTKWTFAALAEQLAKPDAHGNHDAATRKALKAFSDKMKTPPKA